MEVMNVETRKISLISWITHLNDENILSKLESLQNTEADWWDLISDEEKSEIEQGLAEIERGETKSHDEVMAKYKRWL
ncbi:MAG: hypothetical protein A2W97_03565 [Bacteroidetes bacterium GWE2_40_63]|nr:MAG: hypothetical protein A2W95_06800 [Bacteroidetes bacterium GWA2_40_14]OFX65389.1 MAG: hypothetical protein A2W84_09885 [Bacteroidetes bacterium GWC2_40_13]OFX73514.1 MAG: hypothetical protein A2W96_02480 [Bacteroidetes bacterium GWD2_40_43]OFX90810.1 MAG: hypothetical protein A2W97_03565 [Bacteroidetes bacterium GWE2_40_63]OFY20558.1 MAG: hypothetical protein A2W88_13275 [Bacteroidetes bacterium GWF2_40_13]OFZ24120.1 MAG: hypothetical protein A2437_10860 [Bacteroidetes bacterium RIFOXYC